MIKWWVGECCREWFVGTGIAHLTLRRVVARVFFVCFAQLATKKVQSAQQFDKVHARGMLAPFFAVRTCILIHTHAHLWDAYPILTRCWRRTSTC